MRNFNIWDFVGIDPSKVLNITVTTKECDEKHDVDFVEGAVVLKDSTEVKIKKITSPVVKNGKLIKKGLIEV